MESSAARRVSLAVLVTALTACGNGDVCHQTYGLLQSFAVNEAACTFAADSGISASYDAGVPEDAWIAACENNLKSCTPDEQTHVASYLSCANALPSFQCKWYPEEITNTISADPSYVTYSADSQACLAQEADAGISAICSNALAANPAGPMAIVSFDIDTNTNWTGTYTVESEEATFFAGGANTAPPSGAETIVQAGNTLTWTNFAAPSIPSCSVTVTADGTTATLPGTICGGWVVTSSYLLLDGDTVSVSASGTDPDGGSFSLSYSMSL